MPSFVAGNNLALSYQWQKKERWLRITSSEYQIKGIWRKQKDPRFASKEGDKSPRGLTEGDVISASEPRTYKLNEIKIKDKEKAKIDFQKDEQYSYVFLCGQYNRLVFFL